MWAFILGVCGVYFGFFAGVKTMNFLSSLRFCSFLFVVKARPGLYENLERPTLQVGKMDKCGVVPVGSTHRDTGEGFLMTCVVLGYIFSMVLKSSKEKHSEATDLLSFCCVKLCRFCRNC